MMSIILPVNLKRPSVSLQSNSDGELNKMKTRLNFFSKLQVRTSLAFLLFSLFIITVLSTSFYYFTSNMLIKDDALRTRTSVNQTGEYISSYLEKIRALSNIIAEHKNIKSALSKSSTEALDSISSLISLAGESDSHIRAVAVISKNGFVITSEDSMSMEVSKDMMKEDWYKAAIASNRMPMFSKTGHSAFASDKSEWTISVYREITSENNEHLGVVLIDISYNFIEDYIKSLNLGEGGYVYIISNSGDIIYHPNSSVISDINKSNELKKLMDGDSKDGNMVYETAVNNSDWKLYGIVAADNVKTLQKNLIKTIFILSLFLVLISVALGGIVVKKLSDPISKLRLAMSSLDENWRHIKINTSGIHEVTELENEYNKLIDRIKLLTENIAKQEKERRIFELKMLQSQINPHFLYNTLDTILWLAQLNENEAVIKVTSALGKLLRLSLSTELDFVTLKKEIDHVRYYLEIQKFRYEEMLQFDIGNASSFEDISVPKLIIQPIVENAIYHGLRPQGGGNIYISFIKYENDIIIIVTDNGVGFDHGKSYGNKPDSCKSPLGGIGLKNVEQRIKLLCGDEYGVFISSTAGKGTTVKIKVKGK